MPGRRRGSSKARAGSLAKLRREIAMSLPELAQHQVVQLGGARAAAHSVSSGSSLSGSRSTKPSSRPHGFDFACRARRASFAVTAMHHGACTRLPNGVSTQTRQSPSSSRQRSTTMSSIARARARSPRAWSSR